MDCEEGENRDSYLHAVVPAFVKTLPEDRRFASLREAALARVGHAGVNRDPWFGLLPFTDYQHDALWN